MNTPNEDNGGDLKPQRTAAIVCDDEETHSRARDLWQSFFADTQNSAPCEAAFMTTAQMARLSAWEEAARFDVVIISVHDAIRFVVGGIAWFKDWLKTDSSKPRVVLLLHDGRQDYNVVQGLCSMVASAGVTMFSHGRLSAAPFSLIPVEVEDEAA